MELKNKNQNCECNVVLTAHAQIAHANLNATAK